jgi:hypothetical protein
MDYVSDIIDFNIIRFPDSQSSNPFEIAVEFFFKRNNVVILHIPDFTIIDLVWTLRLWLKNTAEDFAFKPMDADGGAPVLRFHCKDNSYLVSSAWADGATHKYKYQKSVFLTAIDKFLNDFNALLRKRGVVWELYYR